MAERGARARLRVAQRRRGRAVPFTPGRGSRWIITDVGSEDGFHLDALSIFQSRWRWTDPGKIISIFCIIIIIIIILIVISNISIIISNFFLLLHPLFLFVLYYNTY